jgi:hypothetical protein
MSIEGKHTPGPWGIMAVAVSAEAMPVAIIGQLDRPEGLAGITDAFAVCMVPLHGDEGRPNVSMICAAPVMFGSLKMLRRSGGLSDAMNDHIDAVLALAIAGIEE